MAHQNKQMGDWGETAAAQLLVQRGYSILERQYRCRWGEIDIIARDPDGVLCFVEVKTRSGSGFATARESVTPSKQRKLRTAASCYLARQGLECQCRFDVAEVYWANRSIHYIINAF